jgi:protein-ribulosamine 3-kinase
MTASDPAQAATHVAIARQLSAQLARQLEPAAASSVQGGCINESYRWNSNQGPLFVKVAGEPELPMLEAEAAGLQELGNAQAVRIPRVLAVGVAGGRAYLALEWIDLSPASGKTQARLGEQLARQHWITAEKFGWGRNNTIGRTPQINAWTADWLAFFREHRLRFQLNLAARQGHGGALQTRGEKLLEGLGALFDDRQAAPSLLHGDLWGGNVAADPDGAPVLFDPAVYYGDREADLAMTRLFGGFSAEFYAAYESAWPLPPSAKARVDLYNLYHVLNHLNLFGGGYLRQAEGMIERLLAQMGR